MNWNQLKLVMLWGNWSSWDYKNNIVDLSLAMLQNVKRQGFVMMGVVMCSF